MKSAKNKKKDKEIILTNIFKKVFKINKINKINFTYEKTINWDSLKHMLLVSMVEKKFQTKIDEIEISRLTSFIKFLNLINK
tara:strand:+ start:69 stop:314 length:246 start_codon:yes stop_codon:yes gene_type:complete